MSIIATISGDGFTKELYQRLRHEVNWESDPIKGWIVNAVRFDEDDGIHMVNIWESMEHLPSTRQLDTVRVTGPQVLNRHLGSTQLRRASIPQGESPHLFPCLLRSSRESPLVARPR